MGIEDIDLGEDFDFEQMLNESFENAENNSVVDGVIVEINSERVLVDVGQKIEGQLNISEITIGGEVKYNVGDTIPVMLMGSRGERPSISHKKVLQKVKFDAFAKEHGDNFEDVTIEGKIVSVKQRGGFIIEDADGCEYFMPMAQSYLKTIGAVGKTVKAKVIKVNEAQNSIIVSRKKLIEESKAVKDNKVTEILENKEPVIGTKKKLLLMECL
jgi:small subunit ribosomal protein S1